MKPWEEGDVNVEKEKESILNSVLFCLLQPIMAHFICLSRKREYQSGNHTQHMLTGYIWEAAMEMIKLWGESKEDELFLHSKGI